MKELKAQPLSSFRCELPSSMREAKGKMKSHSLLADLPLLCIERHGMAFDTPRFWNNNALEGVHIILKHIIEGDKYKTQI